MEKKERDKTLDQKHIIYFILSVQYVQCCCLSICQGFQCDTFSPLFTPKILQLFIIWSRASLFAVGHLLVMERHSKYKRPCLTQILIQSWARDRFFASRQRQRDNVRTVVRRKKKENVKASVYTWSSHNEYRHNAKTK